MSKVEISNQNEYLTLDHVRSGDPIYSTYFDRHTNVLIYHLSQSILNAYNNNSKINDDIIAYPGFTGTKTKHLYNNVCSLFEKYSIDVNYLEIGTWYGSSSVSAMYNNKVNDSLFIDNWSQFGGFKDKFITAMDKYITPESNYSFIESDCWEVDVSKLKQNHYNIYLYDGGHSELDQYKALVHYLPILQDTFIFMVDDLCFPNVRDGTFRAFRELGLVIAFRHEIFVSPEDLEGMPQNNKSRHSFWNGVGIYVLQKPKQ